MSKSLLREIVGISETYRKETGDFSKGGSQNIKYHALVHRRGVASEDIIQTLTVSSAMVKTTTPEVIPGANRLLIIFVHVTFVRAFQIHRCTTDRV